jgi:copper chaperone
LSAITMQILFSIPDMSCGHCVRAITEAVQAADAQAQVHADLARHEVQVETTAPREVLAAQLTEAGYPPA